MGAQGWLGTTPYWMSKRLCMARFASVPMSFSASGTASRSSAYLSVILCVAFVCVCVCDRLSLSLSLSLGKASATNSRRRVRTVVEHRADGADRRRRARAKHLDDLSVSKRDTTEVGELKDVA